MSFLLTLIPLPTTMVNTPILYLLLTTTAAYAAYINRESAGVLFLNHDRTIRKNSGFLSLTFVHQIPSFEVIPSMTNFMNDTHACDTFDFLQAECRHAIHTMYIENLNLFNLIKTYNNISVSTTRLLQSFKMANMEKRALLDVSNIGHFK